MKHGECAGSGLVGSHDSFTVLLYVWGDLADEFQDKLVKDDSMKPVAVEIAALLSKRYKKGVWSRKVGRVR